VLGVSIASVQGSVYEWSAGSICGLFNAWFSSTRRNILGICRRRGRVSWTAERLMLIINLLTVLLFRNMYVFPDLIRSECLKVLKITYGWSLLCISKLYVPLNEGTSQFSIPVNCLELHKDDKNIHTSEENVVCDSAGDSLPDVGNVWKFQRRLFGVTPKNWVC
jgi:hypothetical protein